MPTCPAGIDEGEIERLVVKYRDPERKGLVNYRNLHHDIVALSERMIAENRLHIPEQANASDYLAPEVGL